MRQPRTTFAAVVFDLDGTLIDTEELCNAAGIAACKELGLGIDLAFFESLAGIHDARRAELIAAQVGRPVDAAAFMDRWDAHCYHAFAQGVPLKPGVTDLLEAIAAQGLPMAIATSSRRKPARVKIAGAGLAHHFDHVVTVEDVARAKPAPDAYLHAAALLGAEPAQCLAFEDSETGAASAHSAGLTVVQVPDLHPASGAHAHHVAADLLSGARLAGLSP